MIDEADRIVTEIRNDWLGFLYEAAGRDPTLGYDDERDRCSDFPVGCFMHMRSKSIILIHSHSVRN